MKNVQVFKFEMKPGGDDAETRRKKCVSRVEWREIQSISHSAGRSVTSCLFTLN